MGGDQRLTVRVRPRSSNDRIIGYDAAAGVLRVAVKAAPVDNAANTSTIKLLAKVLKIPQGRISIVRGAKSRDKIVAINADASILARLDNY